MASLLVSKRQYEGVYAYWQLDMSPDKNFFIRYDSSIRELEGHRRRYRNWCLFE